MRLKEIHTHCKCQKKKVVSNSDLVVAVVPHNKASIAGE